MIKAARKADANAEPARAFADIFRAPTHEHRATQGRQSGRRGARCEWVERCGSAVRTKQRGALIMNEKSSEESGRKCRARSSNTLVSGGLSCKRKNTI